MKKPPPREASGGTRRLIAIAAVARPHGVGGELRLKVYNDDSDLLLRKPEVLLRLPDGKERSARVITARPTNKALLVRLEGVDDRDAAEALRGAELCVPRDSFPAPEDGEFYACDVEGARAVLANGEEVGLVKELRSYPTCDVLVVAGKGGDLEIPLVASYVEKVDVSAGVVTLVTVDGLR